MLFNTWLTSSKFQFFFEYLFGYSDWLVFYKIFMNIYTHSKRTLIHINSPIFIQEHPNVRISNEIGIQRFSFQFCWYFYNFNEKFLLPSSSDMAKAPHFCCKDSRTLMLWHRSIQRSHRTADDLCPCRRQFSSYCWTRRRLLNIWNFPVAELGIACLKRWRKKVNVRFFGLWNEWRKRLTQSNKCRVPFPKHKAKFKAKIV